MRGSRIREICWKMLTRRCRDLTIESVLQIIVVLSVNRIRSNYTPLSLMLLIASTVIIAPVITAQPSFAQLVPQKEKVVLTAIIVQLHSNRDIGKTLLDRALTNLKVMYPNLDIQLKYLEYPYNQLQSQLLKMLNDTKASGSVDLVSLDQIWLGDFAKKGLLTDLTNYTKNWGRQNDWYPENWDGGFMVERCMEYGHGQILEEYGIGKIY